MVDQLGTTVESEKQVSSAPKTGIKRFEDLPVWQEAKRLAVEIYRISDSPEFARDFGLRDQSRRAAVSIMANIAEGFDRASRKEFAQFLRIALGSASEVKSHVYLAGELKYLEPEVLIQITSQIETVNKQIYGFIKYLQTHPYTKKP